MYKSRYPQPKNHDQEIDTVFPGNGSRGSNSTSPAIRTTMFDR